MTSTVIHDTRIDDAEHFRGYVGSCSCGWSRSQKVGKYVSLDRAYNIVLTLVHTHKENDSIYSA